MIYSIYLIIYFIIHSLLASQKIKEAAKSLFHEKNYRIIFNIIAVVLLIPAGMLYENANKELLFQSTDWTIGAGILILILGFIFLLKSLKGYDGREFLGLKQLNQTTGVYDEVKNEEEELSTKGLNAYVRHPMYFATLLIIWGMLVVIPNNYVLMTTVITTLYLLPGIYLEEQKLILEFGKSYIEYKKTIPMLIPKFGIISELWRS